MISARPLAIVSLLASVTVAASLHAQAPGTSATSGATTPQEQAVQAAVHPLSGSNGNFSGPGVDWIVTQAADAQFVLFGEQHGVDAIPRFVSTIYTRLHPAGFDHLVLEIGPWIARRLSVDTVEHVLQDAPHSITFDYDAELDLLRTSQQLGPPTTGQRVWGLDQMITAIHPFERLAEITPTLAGRRLARGLQLKATLKAGSYLRQGHYADLRVLRDTLAPVPGTESALIVDAAERSMGIFTRYRQGQVDESVQLRETYMTELLTQQYEAAVSADVPLPRAIFKMGGAHVIEGIGPNGVPTLGDFAQRLATSHGSDALNIGIRVYNEDSFGFSPTLMDNRDGILIDYRALRPHLDRLTLLPDTRRADIEGFDAAIFLKVPAEASKGTILDAEADWQGRTLVRLLPLVGSLVILLTSLVWPLAALIRVIRPRPESTEPRPVRIPTRAWIVAVAYALTAAGLLAWQVRILLANPLASPLGAEPASLAPWLTWGLIISAGGLVRVAMSAWREEAGGLTSRAYYTVLSVAALTFAFTCWMWNLPAVAG